MSTFFHLNQDWMTSPLISEELKLLSRLLKCLLIACQKAAFVRVS